MMDENFIFINSVAVALQLFAAYFSYRIYQYNRLGKGWLAVTGALILMAAQRMLLLGLQTGFVSDTLVINQIHDLWFQVAISYFLFIGIYSMMKSFESFDVVDKKVGEKLAKVFRKK